MSVQIAAQDFTVFSWEDVASAIFAAKGIKEGLWFVGVGMSFAGTTAEWSAPEMTRHFPTGQIAVNTVVIGRATQPGPMVFDAAMLVGRNIGQPLVPAGGGTAMIPAAKKVPAKKAAAKKGKFID